VEQNEVALRWSGKYQSHTRISDRIKREIFYAMIRDKRLNRFSFPENNIFPGHGKSHKKNIKGIVAGP
jgi:hypothetical protein